MKQGYLALVLHSHLPYVKHPEEEYFLEENWLFEAITESYLPLLDTFLKLETEGINFKLTMSITPPLANMLKDHLLIERYYRYLKNRIDLVKDEKECEKHPHKKETLSFYEQRLARLLEIFETNLNFDVLKGFNHFYSKGNIELITCTATHEILPLEQNLIIKEAQVKIGVNSFKKHFGKKPRGIWLGECAYMPGIDKILSKCGIEFTVLDTNGVLFGKPTPVFGINAPVVSEDGVIFFGRDPKASKQVWSAQEGYPGDFNYREFYRDIGYEISQEKVKKYMHPAGFRFDSGIKIHKITGKVPLKDKEIYNPDNAIKKAEEHAENFMFNLEREVEYLNKLYRKKPLIVTPFDTELFGHWWFEGPSFLYFLFKKISEFSEVIETVTLTEYVDKNPIIQVSQPNTSTWGDGGYFKVWLNDNTDWIYPHLNVIGKRMIEMAKRYKNPTTLERRILNQMARELLLADSSDWAFLITVGTAIDYATERQNFHINAFNLLYESLQDKTINKKFLEYLEERDSIFPEIKYEIFKEQK